MKIRFSEERLVYPSLAFFCALVSLALGWSSLAGRFNGNFYDFWFRRRGPLPPSESIVIVAVDDETLARYGALPLNRSLLARGIRAIEQAGPRLVAVDLLLTEASASGSDEDLQQALAGPAPVVLAAAMEANPAGRWLRPLASFAGRAAAVGHVHADPDPDGVSRQVLLAKQNGRERYWALALECARLLEGAPNQPITESEDALEIPRVGDGRAPLRVPARRSEGRALRINYAGGGGTFPQIGLASLLSRPEASRELEGKIVFLGVTAQGAGDRLFTPFSAGIGMPGVEIHAHLLHTILSGNYLRPAGDLGIALAVFAIAAVTAGALFFLRGRFHGAGLGAALAGTGFLLLALPYSVFLRGQVWPGFSLLLPYGMSLLLCGTYQLVVVRRKFGESESKRLRSQQQFEMAVHEIRTPLTAIQGSSELLRRYSLDDAKRQQMIRLIADESERLGKLVERFLRVERLSAGEMELRLAPLDLSALLSAAIERARPAAERKGIRLVREDGVAEAGIEADRELLDFAISNLVTNAVKYSPAGTPVTLALERDRDQVLLHVSDSGPGMTPEECRRVFDRFYRTEQALHSDAPGFGLGLSIAREIASHHGGDLRVESRRGAGSRFTISIPVSPVGQRKRA